MLTADLLRARVRNKRVHPEYLHPDDPDASRLAETLLYLFRGSSGRTLGSLVDEVEGLLGTGTAFQLHRGLARLLFDRCEFAAPSERDAAAIRSAVFDTAARARAKGRFDRQRVLEAAAAELGIEPEEVDRLLFSDLKSEQVVREFRDLTAMELIDRYNLALAQGLLLRARSVEVSFPAQDKTALRRLFHGVKFHRLLFALERSSPRRYRLRLDGPLSAVRATQRYGIQLARFLPRVLELEDYRLEALVRFGRGNRERTLVIRPEDGLKPPRSRRAPGWEPEEMGWLAKKLPRLTADWEVSTDCAPVDLGDQAILLPDYTFAHRPTGRRVPMEIVGFWRRATLESRLALLREHGRDDWMLAVGSDLRLDEGDLEGIRESVYVFRSAPVARDVLRLLEQRIARVRGES